MNKVLRCGACAIVAAVASVVGSRVMAADVGVVSHVKVLSDKVEDVSSLEDWKKSFIKPGMTDQEKAVAVWKSVVMFRHQEAPPNEFLEEDHPHDPIKDFNVYGYGQCCCASANIEQLSRYAGMEARGWGITAHSVPEVKVGQQWCMLDASLVNYFKKPDGTIAGVEEINKSINDWYAKNPGFKGNDKKLGAFMRGEGWKKGPEVLAGGTGYDQNGWLPAATHGWYSSMAEFGGKNFLYEYGAAVGYEVNVQLRKGEKLVRNWSNKGLHVNMLEGGQLSALKENPSDPQGQLRYSPKLGDLTQGRVGNGTLEYNLPMANGAFRDGMLVVENLATKAEDGTGPAVHVKDAGKPGVLIFRMPSSYVYLGGQVEIAPIVGESGSIVVSLSDNNGLDWKEVGKAGAGSAGQTIDLKKYVYRRYDYRLKFEMTGKGTGLDMVKVTHDIQHSQRPLPALSQGDNKIAFSEGAQEGTITMEGNLNPEGAQGKNLNATDFHPQLKGIGASMLRVEGGTGVATYQIDTPGDLARLRVGTHYRVRDARDVWNVEASFDGGKTFVPVTKLAGPSGGTSAYSILDKVPSGVRSTLVRLTGEQRNTTCMLGLRIDADYKEPHGAVAPVKVTYAWEEDAKAKSDVHMSKEAAEGYVIHCEAKPVMKSITLERAD